MNIFMFLTFFYMFIVLSTSTFTTISYIPIERRVPKMHKKPRRRVLSCGGAANAKLLFLPSYQHGCQSYGGYYK